MVLKGNQKENTHFGDPSNKTHPYPPSYSPTSFQSRRALGLRRSSGWAVSGASGTHRTALVFGGSMELHGVLEDCHLEACPQNHVMGALSKRRADFWCDLVPAGLKRRRLYEGGSQKSNSVLS